VSTNRSTSPKPPRLGRFTVTALSTTSTAAVDLGANVGWVTFVVPDGGAYFVFDGSSSMAAADANDVLLPAGVHTFDIGPDCRYFRAILAADTASLYHWVG
jgi:hypothetical protein